MQAQITAAVAPHAAALLLPPCSPCCACVWAECLRVVGPPTGADWQARVDPQGTCRTGRKALRVLGSLHHLPCWQHPETAHPNHPTTRNSPAECGMQWGVGPYDKCLGCHSSGATNRQQAGRPLAKRCSVSSSSVSSPGRSAAAAKQVHQPSAYHAASGTAIGRHVAANGKQQQASRQAAAAGNPGLGRDQVDLAC